MNKKLAAGIIAVICAICTPIIAYYEGYVPRTYRDSVNVPTACFGHTGDVLANYEYTRAECDKLLAGDVLEALHGIDVCIDKELKPNEWAALTSLAFNVGTGAVCRSTIVRMIKEGKPPAIWCEQFDRWIYAGGKVLTGLIKRRASEKMLCLGLVG